MPKNEKSCLLALAAILLAVTLAYEATDGRAIRAAEGDKPQHIILTGQAVAEPLVEVVERRREAQFWESVPLSPSCREALLEACKISGVPLCDALGVIEVESNFQVDAVSSEGCVGLMQLNTKYFPAALSPEDNIRAGVAYLGELLERYEGDTQAALTAYNAGHDTGSRTYARAVMAAAEKWWASQ